MATAVYYNKVIRKIVVGFGNLFNDIDLVRYDASDNEVQRQKVPIFYGPRERYVMRLEGDPNLDRKTQLTLPLMSFEMTGLEYDSSRKQVTNSKNFARGSTNSSVLAQYNPVPYNFDFSLSIYVRNVEDGTQIIEHILPFFTPDYTIKINMIPEMGIVKEIPIVLKDTKYEVDYEGGFEGDVRKIIWTLNFTAKGFVYGPISSGKIITKSITQILDDAMIDGGNVDFVLDGVTGTFTEGELVYQGASADNSTATARVKAWVPSRSKLTVVEIEGNFVSGSDIHGVSSFASGELQSYYIQPTIMVSANSVPNPISANVTDNYTVTTTIREFPNT
jgi:hypothetical protein